MLCLNTALKFLPVHTMKTYWGSRGIVPLIRNVGARWMWVFNFTSQLLYPQERTRFSLNRGWVFTIVVLEVLAKRKMSCTLLQFKP
jgi:hypothetical protein